MTVSVMNLSYSCIRSAFFWITLRYRPDPAVLDHPELPLILMGGWGCNVICCVVYGSSIFNHTSKVPIDFNWAFEFGNPEEPSCVLYFPKVRNLMKISRKNYDLQNSLEDTCYIFFFPEPS